MDSQAKLQSNRVKCNACGDVIESKSRHDIRVCSCGRTAVDGGLDYARTIGDDWTDLRVYLNPEPNDSVSREGA